MYNFETVNFYTAQDADIAASDTTAKAIPAWCQKIQLQIRKASGAGTIPILLKARPRGESTFITIAEVANVDAITAPVADRWSPVVIDPQGYDFIFPEISGLAGGPPIPTVTADAVFSG